MRKISWEEFHSDTLMLCKKIEEQVNLTNIKGLVCITRGGLAPCSIISSYLNIKKIELFSVSSYNDKNEKGEHHLMKVPQEAVNDKGRGWIVIDELVDQGSTYSLVKKLLPESQFFCVYSKNKLISPKEYIVEIDDHIWVNFPWEVGNEQ